MLKGQKINFRINSHQKHDAINSAAAVLASNLLGLSTIEIQKIIPELTTSKRRGSISYLNHSSGSKVTIVDDAYNASYESTVSAITSLRNLSLSSPVLILGDMLELGKKSHIYHKKMSKIINNTDIDKLFVYGKNILETYKYTKRNKQGKILRKKNDFDKIFSKLIKKNDNLMIKGSNGTGLYRLSKLLIKGKNNVI